MEFIKVGKDKYMIVGSNNKVIDKQEMLELKKQGLVIEELNADKCVKEIVEERIEVEKELNETIKKTNKSTKRHN